MVRELRSQVAVEDIERNSRPACAAVLGTGKQRAIKGRLHLRPGDVCAGVIDRRAKPRHQREQRNRKNHRDTAILGRVESTQPVTQMPDASGFINHCRSNNPRLLGTVTGLDCWGVWSIAKV
jgi:hypothetical protein